MIKKHKWSILAASLVTLLPILFGLLLRNKILEAFPGHWGVGATGQGWSGIWAVVIGLPLVLLALQWLCLWLTTKDTKGREQSSKVTGLVLWIIPMISLFTTAVFYAAAVEKTASIQYLGLALFGLLFMLLGNYMPKCKQSFTLGIKIRWTLISEENWYATHRFAGKLWFIGGLLLFAGMLLPLNVLIWAFPVFLLGMILPPVLYSWLYYKKQVEQGTVDPKAEIPMKKGQKRTLVGTLISVGVVLIVIFVLVFSASFKLTYGDGSFTVSSAAVGDITVDYDAIESVEYREEGVPGHRVLGFGDMPLKMGTFQNKEFGHYTRYTYNSSKAVVVIRAEGKVLVLNGKDAESTQAIYETLKNK